MLAAAAHARAEADAALPALIGTPKQIRWANQIRTQAIRNARMLRRRAKQRQDERVVARLDEYLANVLQKKASALWFIDNRRVFVDFPGVLRRMPEFLPQEQSSEAEREARAEMTLRPASGARSRRTEITVLSDGLLLMYPQDFDFLGVVDRHDLKWDPESLGWRGNPALPGDPAADRAAALAADLLAEGYAVWCRTTPPAGRLVRSRRRRRRGREGAPEKPGSAGIPMRKRRRA